MRRFGISYQSGALWSSMTLAENVRFRWKRTPIFAREIREIVTLKLSLGGLAGFEDFHPLNQRRHVQAGGLARGHALDPDILFFDEPSAG